MARGEQSSAFADDVSRGGRAARPDASRRIFCAYSVPTSERPGWGPGRKLLQNLVGMAGFEPTTP